jgi:D-tyrosyl-tRNA(Tyr) deacylase
MRTVIQRVSEASVTIDSAMKSSIQAGLLILLGIEDEDNADDI